MKYSRLNGDNFTLNIFSFDIRCIKLNIEKINNSSSSNLSVLKEKENDVWNYFDKYKNNNNILYTKCYHYNKSIYNMSGLNLMTRNLIKHLKLHSDKTNSSIKKQVHFMVKFLNNSL